MAQKISVNQNKCIGCGACEATCPGGFKLKDGEVHVKDNNASCAKDAADGCPTGAISIKG